MSLEMISPKDAQAAASNSPQVKFLDVRTVLEFGQTHIKDSLNIPIDLLAEKTKELSIGKADYIIICRTGNRSAMAADILIQSGIHLVKVMEGGIARWQKEGFPVIKGIQVISLERQIRIIAGSLVLSGIFLSRFFNPWFIAISIFVSCGLVYAGLTDNCLMGMLLMKLPYNKKLYKIKSGGGACSIK